MYNIEILNKLNWESISESEDIHEIDKLVWYIVNNHPKTHIRVLLNDIVLMNINGTEYEYFIWKNKIVRERKPEYDYVREYHKRLEKRKK